MILGKQNGGNQLYLYLSLCLFPRVIVSTEKKGCMYMCVLSCVRLFVTPWTVAGLLCPWGFPGKNTGVGFHFLLQGGLPNPGIEPAFSLAGVFFTAELSRNPKGMYWIGQKVHSSTLTNFLASAIYKTLSAVADLSFVNSHQYPSLLSCSDGLPGLG